MLRARCAAGKSLNFVLMMCAGCALGIASRLMDYQQNGELSPVLWLYLWNLGVALPDLIIVVHFSRRARQALLQNAHRAASCPAVAGVGSA